MVWYVLFFPLQHTSYAQGQQQRTKVLLADTKESYTSFYYQKRGLASVGAINQTLVAYLKDIFPCADFTMMENIRAMINFNRQQNLFGSGENAGDFLENIIGELGSMDYLLTTSYGNIIDENHWSLSASLIHIGKKKRPFSVDARAYATAQGSASSSIMTMIQEVVKQLSKAEICPWVGTITVSKTKEQDTTSTTVTSGEKSTSKHTITKQEKTIEAWSIDASGKNNNKGSVKYEMVDSYREEVIASGNVPCFRSPEPCVITDEFMPGSFSRYLLTKKNVVNGTKRFDNLMLEVVRDFDSGNYSLSIQGEPMFVGKGESEEYESNENSCGRCVLKDVQSPSVGTVWAGWIVEGHAAITDQRLSNKKKIQEEDGTVTEIAWDLHK